MYTCSLYGLNLVTIEHRLLSIYSRRAIEAFLFWISSSVFSWLPRCLSLPRSFHIYIEMYVAAVGMATNAAHSVCLGLGGVEKDRKRDIERVKVIIKKKTGLKTLLNPLYLTTTSCGMSHISLVRSHACFPSPICAWALLYSLFLRWIVLEHFFFTLFIFLWSSPNAASL